jgi:DNA-binding response OmpR family regulator
MNKHCILWIDDEVDFLKPHFLFLNKKGYDVIGCNNAREGLAYLEENEVGIVLLDENMPGISGLETLAVIEDKGINVPVIMVTNNQEEYTLNEALSNKVVGFLLKPVHPNQVYVSVKKVLEQKQIAIEKKQFDFLSSHLEIAEDIYEAKSMEAFYKLYQSLVKWQIEFENSKNKLLLEMLEGHFQNANLKFSEFVADSYESWIQNGDGPIFSHELLDKKIIPLLKGKKTLVLLLDNLRADHWQTIKPSLEAQFNVVRDDFYTAILPTVTQYARNAIFAGLLPIEIKNKYPKQWKEDIEEGLKNEFEALFFKEYCERKGLNISHSYAKINHSKQASDYIKDFKKIAKNELNFAVVGFIDQLSHAKITHPIINDITHNNKAYRDTTLNWFSNTYLQDILKLTLDHNIQLIITTDH